MWKLCWDTIRFVIWISNIGYFKEGRKEWFVPKVVPMNKSGGTSLFCGPAKNLDRVSLSHLWKLSFFSKYIPPLVLVNQSVTLQFCRAAWIDDISSSSDERIWYAVGYSGGGWGPEHASIKAGARIVKRRGSGNISFRIFTSTCPRDAPSSKVFNSGSINGHDKVPKSRTTEVF